MGSARPNQSRGGLVGRSPAKRAGRMPREQRREHLIRAATDLVRNNGIEALTMAALAEQAGVSKPVVYEHFANSEEVSLALLDEYFINIVKVVGESTQAAETLEEYIVQAIDAEFDFHADGALSIRSITNGHTSSHATGDRLNAAYLKIREQATGTFRELLLQQGVSGEIAAVSGYVLAEMLNTTVPEYGGHDERGDAREVLKTMMLAAIHAVCPDPKARPSTPKFILEELQKVIAKA